MTIEDDELSVIYVCDPGWELIKNAVEEQLIISEDVDLP